MNLSFSGISDQGHVRSDNQDSIFLPPDGVTWPCFFLVADGMGGANGGQTASEMATRIIPQVFLDHLRISGAEKALRLAVQVANTKIFERAEEDPRLRGMGTTLVGLFILEENNALVVNVGDSRCYLLRDGELHQITEDHSVVQEMVRNGKMSQEQARQHGMRNMLSKALGTSPNIVPDLFSISRIELNDLFLLCSDGLHGPVPHDQLLGVLAQPIDISSKAQSLLKLANDNGGPDNISVILIRVNQQEYSPEADEITLNHSFDEHPETPMVRNGRKGFLTRLFGK